jgi:hypothetical protein
MEPIFMGKVRYMSELLDLALQAAGGLECWRQVHNLYVHFSVTDALFPLKGYPEGVPEATMRIDTRTPSVIISPYTRPDYRGYFTPDRVWIEDRAGKIRVLPSPVICLTSSRRTRTLTGRLRSLRSLTTCRVRACKRDVCSADECRLPEYSLRSAVPLRIHPLY